MNTMDYDKAKLIIKKLNALLDSFQAIGEPISEIESEMLHKYVDKLKSLIPGEIDFSDQEVAIEKTKVSKPEPPKVEITKKKVDVDIPKPDQINTQKHVPQEAEPVISHNNGSPSSHTDDEFDVPPVQVESEKKEKPQPVKKEVVKAKKKVLVASEEDHIGDTAELWQPVEIKEISHKLSFSPINNIYKSISINERIFTVNELFGGDSGIFKTVLERLEKFDSFDEAVSYLKNGIAKDQDWESSKKIKKANNFMRLVQRRYL